MELIAKVSKGSKMDQIYIPKNRAGLSIGSYVVLSPLELKKKLDKPYFYNVKSLENIKVSMIDKLMTIIENCSENDNVIFTGSFLEKGFNFSDIDIIIVSEKEQNTEAIQEAIKAELGIESHIINLNNSELLKGLSTDPIYEMMLSKCVSKKRLIHNVKREINYKLLDLHLLKSKTLTDNFDSLNGKEKYYFVRNLLSIHSFIKMKKLSTNIMDKEIENAFNISAEDLKNNKIQKKEFLKKYNEIYNKTFNTLMEGINGSKQKS